MSDITLSDGSKITIDLYKISLKEYDTLFVDETADKQKRELMARCVGMTGEELTNLPFPDGAKIQRRFWRECREIFEEPKNSESAST